MIIEHSDPIIQKIDPPQVKIRVWSLSRSGSRLVQDRDFGDQRGEILKNFYLHTEMVESADFFKWSSIHVEKYKISDLGALRGRKRQNEKYRYGLCGGDNKSYAGQGNEHYYLAVSNALGSCTKIEGV